MPEGLDFYGIALSGGAGRMMGIHPGKVGWAENQPRVRVHAHTIGCAGFYGVTD